MEIKQGKERQGKIKQVQIKQGKIDYSSWNPCSYQWNWFSIHSAGPKGFIDWSTIYCNSIYRQQISVR